GSSTANLPRPISGLGQRKASEASAVVLRCERSEPRRTSESETLRGPRFAWPHQGDGEVWTCAIARILWSAPGRPSSLSSSRSLSRGAERRQTRGFCETPDGWWRNHPVGRFAKASPRSFRNEAPPGAPQRRSIDVRAAL